jgi:hypothetical protein
MEDYLESGSWFNKSRRFLVTTAVLTALGFIAFCAATEYFVAQYFVCIGNCKSGNAPFLLLAVSSFLALIPVVGTAVIGYWIVRGLWDDAGQAEGHSGSAK